MDATMLRVEAVLHELWSSPVSVDETRAELADAYGWRGRNAWRSDPMYVGVQKPANDRRIARLEAMLADVAPTVTPKESRMSARGQLREVAPC